MLVVLIVITSLFFITSCSYDWKENETIRASIEHIDNAVWCDDASEMTMSYQQALDSLIMMDISKMSNANEAYYNLMYVILSDKVIGNDYDTDSIITWSTRWYKDSEDHYNYVRALLYRGITMIRIDPRDYAAFSYLKDAQRLYEECPIDDIYLKSAIYQYIGEINMNVGNLQEAEAYYVDRYAMNGQLARPEDNLASQIDYSYLEIAKGDYVKAKELIDELTLVYDIPEGMANSVLELEIAYFEIFDLYASSIETCMRYEPHDISEEIVLEYSFARLYWEWGKLDSAAVHADKLIDLISGTEKIENYRYYNLSADIFASRGEYCKASELYFISRKFHQMELEQTRDNKILELEVKYRSLVKEQEILALKERSDRILFICIILSLVVVVLLLVLSIIKAKNYQTKLFMKLNESKLRNVELMKTVMDASLGLLPSFHEKSYSIILRNSASSEVALKEFNELSTSIKKELKERLSKVVADEDLSDLDPMFSHLKDFSTQEQIIIFLSYLECKSDFIAKVLNTSASSIRGMKSRIREKSSLSEVLTDTDREKLTGILGAK